VPLPRRRFLGWAGSAAWIAPAALDAAPEPAPDFERSLQAWAETLFPGDDDAPGAGELELHRSLIDLATATPNYPALLRAGAAWIDAEAGAKQAFADLDVDDREAIVARAEMAGRGTPPRQFFNYTRRDLAELYYARRESWAGLGLPHPPQPIGFPDYAQPPS